MVSALNRFNNALGSIEYLITVPIFLAMLTLMIIQVIFRYFLHSPLPWSEEMIRYAFIAATYLGGAIATMEREHIEINIIEIIIEKYKNDPEKYDKIVKITNAMRDLLAAIFLSLVVYQTWFLVADQLSYKMISPAAQVPMWIVTGFMLVGLSLMIVHSLLNIPLNLNGYGKTGYEGEEEGGDRACSL